MKLFSLLLLVVGIVYSQSSDTRTIVLKNGDKITGSYVAENDSAIVLKTSFGEITILRSNIKPQSITIYLKDGNIITGDVVTKNDATITLSTTLGVLTIDNNNIERTTEAGLILPGTVKSEEFFYSEERLVDIFFDPTAHTMEKGVLYFSGLSWGVALSEKVEISSSYWRYFFPDLNIRPKFQVFKSGNLQAENSAAVGFHLHSAGPTGKYVYKEIEYKDVFGNVFDRQKRWEDVGTASDYFLWTEVFAAYTYSVLKGDKQGRVSYHAGASTIFHKTETMPRAWVAVENDITTRFKVIGQIFYDPYSPSYREKTQNSKSNNPIDLDFGFVYAVDENLRFGIHYQPYIILFYFKF